jgi:hypothetical protein
MDVKKQEAAEYTRRLLRHPEFDTVAKRMGKVIRVSPMRLAVWYPHAEKEIGSLGFRGVTVQFAAFCRHILGKITLTDFSSLSTVVEWGKFESGGVR